MSDEIRDANVIRVYRLTDGIWAARIGDETQGLRAYGHTPRGVVALLMATADERGWMLDPTWKPREIDLNGELLRLREENERLEADNSRLRNARSWAEQELAMAHETCRRYERDLWGRRDEISGLNREIVRLKAELLNHTNARACATIVAHARDAAWFDSLEMPF